MAHHGLAFSGSGHLLCYHLGVARTLLQSSGALRFDRHFCGSSGGAVVACVAAVMPERLEDFHERFASRCKALTGIREMLPTDAHLLASHARLHVQLTEASSGRGVQVSRFESREHLLDAVFASCRIPRSFHPFDALRSRPPTYSAAEGKRVAMDGEVDDGRTYVDGAFSAPLPLPDDAAAGPSVTVTPLAGPPAPLHICPVDTSLRLGTARLGRDHGGMAVYRSLDNVRRLVVAGGAPPAVLHRLFEGGCRDAEAFLSSTTLRGAI